MIPKVKHRVIRIDFGGDRSNLIDRPRLSCPSNSPHGWRKRAFPSLGNALQSSNPPPRLYHSFILTHTPGLRLQHYGPSLDFAVYGLRVGPQDPPLRLSLYLADLLLELLVGGYDIPFLGWLSAMNRLNTCAPLGIPFLWLSGQRYAIEIRIV